MKTTPKVVFLDRSTPPNIVTLILLAGTAALAMNIFLPSLPEMAVYFDTPYRLLQLSVAVYLAVNALLQIIIGPLSDKLGRRPIILWGVGLFVVATFGCIFAPDAFTFLVFRMMQAVIVAAMVLSRAVVRDMYPPDKAGSMIGYVTMGVSVAPMLGPFIGGVLGEAFGWKANFWLLALLGIFLFGLAWRDLGETGQASGLTFSQQFREYPELLKSPRFWGYAMSSALSSGAFFAYLGGAPYVGTVIFDLSPSQLGLYFGAPAVGYFIGNGISGRFGTRVGIDKMVLWGTMIITGGMIASCLVFWSGFGTAITFFGFMSTVGLGNGMTIPNATAGALSVRPHLAGTAAGLSGAIMIGGGAALSALAGALLKPGLGAWPLLWIMLITAFLSICAISFVIWRTKKLGGLEDSR